jgi:methenyltetrahydromethanopterin cyclohydrolase
MTSPTLNERAWHLADRLAAQAEDLRIAVHRTAGQGWLLDCGAQAPGGLQAGLALARVCLAGLAEVSLVAGGALPGVPGVQVQVATDHPLRACLASQYAGWQIQVGSYFAMGSGPMRAAYGKEELYNHIPGKETPPVAVGVLETGQLPPEEVVAYLAERLQLPPDKLALLLAPTTSLAGSLQVVARSLETALHKLHELHFDLAQVVSGAGTAPLPPPAAKTIEAIGRTNDAILYGGQVNLWVRARDDVLAEIGPRVPSSASPDHGAPFAEVFRRYNHDFYKVDKLLFSPAVICFHNLMTGRTHTFGRLEPEILRRSFLGG